MPSEPTRDRYPYHLLLIFLLLSTGIIVSGYLYYRNYELQYRAKVEQELSAIAEMKVDELVDWKEERMKDAVVFYKNENFSSRVRQYLAAPADMEAKTKVRTWMHQFQVDSQYSSLFLLDRQGIRRLSVPDTVEPAAPHLVQNASKIIRSGKIVFLDFHRDGPDRPIHLSILVPILDTQERNRAIGVLVLRVDPEKYLYPFINRWPTHSRTAETLIVRRDGNDALFLNELRFQKNTALKLRIPLENVQTPAVKAVLGQKGIDEGIDYRGVPVIADVRPVPDSPWFLVTRMDTSEVYTPLRERLWEILILISALLICAAAGTGFAWRHQRTRFYREKYEAAEALRASEERYRTVADYTYDWEYWRGEDGGIRYMSPSCERITGYRAEEFIEDPGLLESIVHPDDRGLLAEHKSLSGESATDKEVHEADFRIIRRDGGVRWIAHICRPIRRPDGTSLGKRATNRDVTERKQGEEALRESEEQFRAMFEVASIGIAQADIRTGKWLRVNQKMCEITGYSEDEMLRMKIPEITHPDDRQHDWDLIQGVVRGESPDYRIEKRYIRKDSSIVWVNVNMTVVRDAGGQPLRTMAAIEDVTERRQAAHEREIMVEFLEIINRGTGFSNLVREAATFFQRQSGCEAVGIRLKKNDDYPYYEVRGFSDDFVKTENSLCSRDKSGEVARDEWGNPVLACMCGNIICGRFDPSKPFFSPGGSFWSNNTTELLASTTEADRQARTRNRCNGEGYESVALIPLRVGQGRMGLIQLNDRRKGMFSPEIIALWERLAGYLAVALGKSSAEEALRENEAFIKVVLDNLPVGVAVNSVDSNVIFQYMNDNFPRFYRTTREKLSDPGSFWSTVYEDPAFRTIMKQRIVDDCASGNPERMYWADVPIMRKGEETSFITARNIPVPDKPLMISTVWDVTDRKRAEQEIVIRNRIATIFLTSTSEEEMYAEVLRIVLEFMESKYGVVGYIDEEGALVVPSMSRHIWDKCQVPERTFIFERDKWGHSSWPRAIREKKSNYTNEPSALTPEGHIAINRHISMPVVFQGEVIGLLQVANKETDYTEKDVRLLELLGNTIIAPILNARLQRDRQEKARRIAEEELKHNEARMIALLELNKMTDLTIQDITSFTLEEAIRLTESQIGYLAFLNEDETVLTMYAWSKTAMEECADFR